MSRHIDMLKTAHTRAQRRQLSRNYKSFKGRGLILARSNRDFEAYLRRSEIYEGQKRGRRIWWPLRDQCGWSHLFTRAHVALAEGGLTPRPGLRPVDPVPFGNRRHFLEEVPF